MNYGALFGSLFLLRTLVAEAQFCNDPLYLKQDRPDLAWEQEFERTKDPSLGYVPSERLQAANKKTQTLIHRRNALKTNGTNATISWEERGPSNIGGRTRALMFDPNDVTHKKVWAGGVSGGLWYNLDITDEDSSWIKIDDFWENICITAIAADPNNNQIFYVGTGESRARSGRGAGVWKSTDAGTTWTQLTNTTDFHFVNDILVRNESGQSVLYVAVAVSHYVNQYHGNSEGLQRSTDGGATFTQVLPNIPSTNVSFRPVDVELAADNRLFVGSGNRLLEDEISSGGGGYILFSDDGTSWTIVNDYSSVNDVGRVELACAPSNANILYGIIEAGNKCERVIQSLDRGATWSDASEPVDVDNGIPASDFTRGQAWYDLSLAVDPNNSSRLIIGGIDLFISTDGATTWEQISQWTDLGEIYSFVHADQHAAVFSPGSSNTIIFGNDGGVFYTNDLGNAPIDFVIFSRNNNYNVTQFYSCAISPQANSNQFLAGSQDNGTQYFENVGINETFDVNGGDGGYCFIDEDEPDFAIVSYVFNVFTRINLFDIEFSRENLSNDQSSGSFINPAGYDGKENILYSAYNTTSIQVITGVTDGNPDSPRIIALGLDAMATHFKISPNSSLGNSIVFIGTESGSVLKVTNAHLVGRTVVDITGNLPNGSISAIDIGATDNDLIVTYFNYGLTSVWETHDGGATWINKEGNLPDMPIRWCLYNPDNRNQVLLATETGVWLTDDISVLNPDWQPANTGLANARVDMLRYRNSDKLIAAATYGRGLFTSSGFAGDVTPPAVSSFSPADNATGVFANSNLVITFSESVQKGTGDILIKEGGIITQTINVSSNLVTIASNVVTINTADFAFDANVNIEIATTAFKDLVNNEYEGISNNTTWNFTIASLDLNPPTVLFFTPLDESSNVDANELLAIKFSEPIQKASGFIRIKEAGVLTQTIDVTSPSVVILFDSLVLINPSNFSYDAAVSVEIDTTAFKDLSDNNYAGISDLTTWNFTSNSNSIKTNNSIENILNLYPNPTNGEITINFYSEQQTTFGLKIDNSLGQTIFSDNIPSFKGEYLKKINLSSFSKGIYFISLITDKGSGSKKIVLR